MTADRVPTATVCGRVFTQGDLKVVRRIIAADAGTTRAAIARHTCEALAWRTARPEDRLDGANLLPWLLGQDPRPPHDVLFWRYRDRFAIRQGDLKLVRTDKAAEPRLFDLAADPGETTDLAAERPEDAQTLLAAWEAWNGELMDPLWQRSGGRSAKRGKDADGAVDRIQSLSSRYGVKRASLFDALDQDGDGRVTWDEVEEWNDQEEDLSEPPGGAVEPPLRPAEKRNVGKD
ncbi:MAG: hypothetical protein HY812_04395 [Planctomycetes bacterium]|nr:hypothetical protein [Planctomycetota bacterium]